MCDVFENAADKQNRSSLMAPDSATHTAEPAGESCCLIQKSLPLYEWPQQLTTLTFSSRSTLVTFTTLCISFHLNEDYFGEVVHRNYNP